MIRHPKRRGEWVEMQFMARAAAHGLTVSKPWGDSARYDFIVESRGLCQRVQVKSTTSTQGDSYKCTTRTTVPYNAKQVDFIACYIIPEDIWYIVPTREMIWARSGVFLNPRLPRNRYFRYMEAWHLLKRGPATKGRRSRIAPRVDIQACASWSCRPQFP